MRKVASMVTDGDASAGAQASSASSHRAEEPAKKDSKSAWRTSLADAPARSMM
jgi:hypothetical protein